MIGQLLPQAVKRELKRVIPYYRQFYCPICGTWDREFQTFGLVPRSNARCPSCRSLERHRLIWCFFRRRTDLFQTRGKRMLHFAPIDLMASRLSRLDYLDQITADLMQPAMVRLDITAIPFLDQTVDVVYCSHVLEHVPDDRKAMRECHRVLKSNGWAVFMVPLFSSPTVEDPFISDPKERERLFGQRDHVRKYGPDFVDRLKEAGFSVDRYTPDEVAGPDRARFAIRREDSPIFYCRREDGGRVG